MDPDPHYGRPPGSGSVWRMRIRTGKNAEHLAQNLGKLKNLTKYYLNSKFNKNSKPKNNIFYVNFGVNFFSFRLIFYLLDPHR